MYNFKKIAALGLAFSMVFGSTVTVFATEPAVTQDLDNEDLTDGSTAAKEIKGEGKEEYVDKNVMLVTVPTDDLIAKAFDYKLDPQGLVAGAKSYDGTAVTGTATGIVFLNNNKGKYTISNTSDAFTITNKSSIPVDLGVEVYLTEVANGIEIDSMSTTSDFSGTNDASKTIYLGLKATNDTERVLNFAEANKKNYNATLLSGESQYESKWVVTDQAAGTGEYQWAAKTGAKFSDFTFTVTGAMNKTLENSTWINTTSSGFTTKQPPKVSLKYTLTPVNDALPLTLKWTTDANKNDVLQIAMTSAPTGEGGFAALPTKVYINGRDVTSAAALDTSTTATTHYILVELKDIFSGYSSKAFADADSKEKAAVKTLIKSVKTTTTSKPTYYGQF